GRPAGYLTDGGGSRTAAASDGAGPSRHTRLRRTDRRAPPRSGARMSGHVLDASAVLAVAFMERGADRVIAALGEASISAVNYSEACAKLVEKGLAHGDAVSLLQELRLPVIDFDRK